MTVVLNQVLIDIHTISLCTHSRSILWSLACVCQPRQRGAAPLEAGGHSDWHRAGGTSGACVCFNNLGGSRCVCVCVCVCLGILSAAIT